MDKNSEVWTVDADIPTHIQLRKRRHPQDIINPDEPPQREVVKAIKFLKQNNLPGSLLGEWQYPLPSIEVIQTPLVFLPLGSLDCTTDRSMSSHNNGM